MWHFTVSWLQWWLNSATNDFSGAFNCFFFLTKCMYTTFLLTIFYCLLPLAVSGAFDGSLSELSKWAAVYPTCDKPRAFPFFLLFFSTSVEARHLLPCDCVHLPWTVQDVASMTAWISWINPTWVILDPADPSTPQLSCWFVFAGYSSCKYIPISF